MNTADLVRSLDLKPHPEGGFYRETYRAAMDVAAHGGTRAASTAIYFLLEGEQFSALHRIKSDEVWHFYRGSPLEIIEIAPDGTLRLIELSHNHPQDVIPAGRWFGSRVKDGKGFALVGCTVAPGFDFADFEMGAPDDLLSQYPQHADIIRELTRS